MGVHDFHPCCKDNWHLPSVTLSRAFKCQKLIIIHNSSIPWPSFFVNKQKTLIFLFINLWRRIRLQTWILEVAVQNVFGRGIFFCDDWDNIAMYMFIKPAIIPIYSIDLKHSWFSGCHDNLHQKSGEISDYKHHTWCMSPVF